MCLGGGSAAPTYRPPPPRVVEPGPESPQDMVSGQAVENITDRSQQEAMRQANRGERATAQRGKASQSKSKSDKAY
jgi:hypothetical protein